MENSEQLVGIKVARLLKALGFDWKVTSCYNDNPDLKEDLKIEKDKIMREFFEVINEYPWIAIFVGIFILICIETILSHFGGYKNE